MFCQRFTRGCSWRGSCQRTSGASRYVRRTASVAFGYDPDSRRFSLALPNGNTATYNYDAASQLLGIVYQGGALGVANLAYSYDLAGRRVAVSGSLASEQLPAAVSSAAYNANNQLTQWGSTAMTYDLNGNTLSDGMNTYTWDARNRLASANSNGATFSYDPLGRRVSKTLLSATTNFLYDGPNPVQEQNGSGVTANLLTGGIDERFQRTDSTGAYSYLTDALGSTMALTNSTGAEQTTYSYGPYGALSITGSTTNSYDYTGRESDGLGLHYYRARYYNPQTGRFISEDPIGFAGGINQYAYVGDSPLNFDDPTGQDKKNPFQCAADSADNVSLASLTGLGDAGGVTGFAANALGGNAFSGATNLITSFATGSGGGHSVYYNMAQGLVAGPSMGFSPVVQAVMDANGSNVVMTTLFNGDVTEGSSWVTTGAADIATNDVVETAFNEVTGAGDSLVTLSGEASLASTAMTGAEFASGLGEFKLGYDFATYVGALGGCVSGLL